MQRRTILIVDDSETDRLILKRHLGRDGAYVARHIATRAARRADEPFAEAATAS